MRPDPSHVFKIGELLLPAFIQQHKEELEDREGLCLAIMIPSVDHGFQIASTTIGYIPADKLEAKQRFAREKIERIKELGQISSFQSADKLMERYGGGVQFNYQVWFAASGFQPHLDQDFAILLGLHTYQMTLDRAMDIRRLTRDKYPAGFFEKFK